MIVVYIRIPWKEKTLCTLNPHGLCLFTQGLHPWQRWIFTCMHCFNTYPLHCSRWINMMSSFLVSLCLHKGLMLMFLFLHWHWNIVGRKATCLSLKATVFLFFGLQMRLPYYELFCHAKIYHIKQRTNLHEKGGNFPVSFHLTSMYYFKYYFQWHQNNNTLCAFYFHTWHYLYIS